MKRLFLFACAVVLLAGIALAGYRFSQARPSVFEQVTAAIGLDKGAAQSGPLQASGIVEAPGLLISSELGGRVTALSVAKGDSVIAGQPLLAVDDSLLQARIAQADAAVAEAQAQLALVQAGARDETIAHARAQLDLAQSLADGAQQAWEDARQLRARPDDLDLKLVEARTALAVAQHQAKAARLQAEAADLQNELWGRVTRLLQEGVDVSLPGGGSLHFGDPAQRDQANLQWNLSGQQAWEAWQVAYEAEAGVDAAQNALADLQRQRANLIALDAQVNRAEGAYRRALSGIDQARAAVQALEEGASSEEIELARQAVEQARSSRAALEAQLVKAHVNAPSAGLITQLAVRLGEVATPGAALVEIANLTEVTLVVYVPASDLGRVRLGQAVRVTVDSFPERAFDGQVTHIADQAEFTPRTIQTKEERVDTVFAVEIAIPNPDAALKPGMPADATFTDRSYAVGGKTPVEYFVK